MRLADSQKLWACALLGVVAGLGYIWALWNYVLSLQNPYPLFFAFMLSPILAVAEEVSHAGARQVLANITGTLIGFVITVLMAHQFRDSYLALISQLTSAPPDVLTVLRTWLGQDILSAIANPSIGYGGCYALGMGLMRWFLHRHLQGLLLSVFIAPSPPPSCPHCNHPL